MGKPMPFHAALTADIVNSTKLIPKVEKLLLKTLEKVFIDDKFEVYRGDSFQAYIKDAAKALQVALLCRTAAKSVTENAECDVRISLGIGNVQTPIVQLAHAKGEAFIVSGRVFDEMRDQRARLTIMVAGQNKETFNLGMQALTAYIDLAFSRMTPRQAQAIFLLLQGMTQQAAGEQLGKSKSTISQLVKAGNWQEIENALNLYKDLIKLIKL